MTARGITAIACGMRSIGVSVFVADVDVSARYPLTGPAVVCVTAGPPSSTIPSGSGRVAAGAGVARGACAIGTGFRLIARACLRCRL